MCPHAKHAHECDVLTKHNGEEPLGDTPSGCIDEKRVPYAQFHERLRDSILQAVVGLAPGARRLRKGTETYLDGVPAWM